MRVRTPNATVPKRVIDAERDLIAAGMQAKRLRVWLARRDVNAFCEYVLKHEKTGASIVQGPMHVLWHKLAAEHSRLIIWSHTEAGKTSQEVGRVLWRLGREPLSRTAILSNTHGQAVKVVRLIKRYIENSRELHEVFPDLVPGDQWTDSAFTIKRDTNSKDPSVQAAGIHANILGSRIDYLDVDDVLDYENTRTEEMRSELWNWYHATPVGRLSDDARVCIIGNAFHPRDLLHRLAASGLYHARKFPVTDPTGRPTWPEAWPLTRIEAKIRELGPLESARQLHCKAFDEGSAHFKPAWMDAARKLGDGLQMVEHLTVTEIPAGSIVITGVDTAVQQHSRADLTALATILVDPLGARRLLWLEAGRWSGPEIVERIIDHHDRYGSIIMVENVGALDYILQFTRERSDATIVPFTTGRQKADPSFGFESLAVEFFNGKWALPSRAGRCHPEVEALIQELLFYSTGAHVGDRAMALWFAREGARRFSGRRQRARRQRNVAAPAVPDAPDGEAEAARPRSRLSVLRDKDQTP